MKAAADLQKNMMGREKPAENQWLHTAQPIPAEVRLNWWTVSLKWWTASPKNVKYDEKQASNDFRLVDGFLETVDGDTDPMTENGKQVQL